MAFRKRSLVAFRKRFGNVFEIGSRTGSLVPRWKRSHVRSHIFQPERWNGQNHRQSDTCGTDRQRGGRVSILDCDPNRNIVDWAASRKEEGKDVPFRVIQRVEHADDFFDQLEAETEYADYRLIDLEGTADQLTTFATQAADLVIIPMTLTYMEAKQAQRAVKVVRQMARATRRDIQTRLLLNRTSTAVQSADHRQMRQSIIDSGADVLPVELMNRAASTSCFSKVLPSRNFEIG